MDIRAAQDFYFDYTAKLNDRVRTLAMTGVGAIWVFKQTTETGTWMPQALLVPGFLLVTALGLDVFQLAYGALAWGWVRRREADKLSPVKEIDVPRWLNWPTTLLFYSKTVLVAVGYILLALYLRSRFSDLVA